jgi:hypothetical protein
VKIVASTSKISEPIETARVRNTALRLLDTAVNLFASGESLENNPLPFLFFRSRPSRFASRLTETFCGLSFCGLSF